MDSLGSDTRMKGFFALRVFVVYVALLLPWPGLGKTYDAWFRVLGRLAATGGGWIVRVEPVPAEEKSPLSTRIVIGNPRMVGPNGEIPAKVLDLDAWGVGWVPTALVLSLIAATKLPMKRRIAALLWGFLLINLYTAFCVRVYLWDGTADLIGIGKIFRSVAGALSYTLVTQMGAGFAMAVIIWLAVAFPATLRDQLANMGEKFRANPARG